MKTGKSRLTIRIPVEATEITVKRYRTNFVQYKRNIPVHRDEVKWNLKRRLITREKLQKRKQKETSFVGMVFMQTKLVFVLLTNYYQLFHAFLNEIDTSRSPGTSRDGVPRSYKPKMKYISGNRDKRSIVLVHWNVPFVLAYSCKVSVKSTHYIISVDIPPLRN